MTSKYFQNRWFENTNTKVALDKIISLLNNGGVLIKDFSPFGVTDNGLIDFRGLNLSQQKIKHVKIENVDLSHSDFSSSWFEKSLFENVIFKNVDFREISDHGNFFKHVSFSKCKFDRAVLGYKGTQYFYCIFENSSFIRTGFLRGEFCSCKFIDSKLKGVDFNASSFEKCSFSGKLENVWFRGDYGYSYGEREFGKAKKNQMESVSFEEAILKGVNFSNDCNLSMVIPPRTGNYKIYDNWANRLKNLKINIEDWPLPQRKEAEIFANSYLVHAKTQDWFLLNIEEIQQDFGVDVASNIIIELNKKIHSV